MAVRLNNRCFTSAGPGDEALLLILCDVLSLYGVTGIIERGRMFVGGRAWVLILLGRPEGTRHFHFLPALAETGALQPPGVEF